MKRKEIVRCLCAYKNDFGIAHPLEISSESQIVAIVALISSCELYEKRMKKIFVETENFISPRILEELHSRQAGTARDLFYLLMKGYESGNVLGEFVAKLNARLESAHSTHKKENESRRRIQDLRTAFFFVIAAQLSFFIFREFVLLGIHSVASVFAVLFGERRISPLLRCSRNRQNESIVISSVETH